MCYRDHCEHPAHSTPFADRGGAATGEPAWMTMVGVSLIRRQPLKRPIVAPNAV